VSLLPESFYARDALVVARDLLGKQICTDDVVLRITEVEAYRGPTDTACHSRVGRTARNAPMWGPPGRVYVYLCYGIHQMLNIVTGDSDGAAVLIRACEVEAGLDVVRARRRGLNGPVLLAGPGRVGAALGLDTSWNHHPLFTGDRLSVRDGEAPSAVLVGKRIGVDYAAPDDRDAPYRLACAGTRWASHPKALR
jgi:DNA-3-methyladenine glycosylase